MIKIYPENYKTRHYCYFSEICFECGALHPYRKYFNWQKREHKAMCFSKKREEEK